MGFLQSIVVALILAVSSLITGPLSLFHAAQSPTVEVSPLTSSKTITSSNQVPPTSSSVSSTATPGAALSTSTGGSGTQSSTDQVTLPGSAWGGGVILTNNREECQSASRVIDLEGNPSGATKDTTDVFNEDCNILAGADPNTFVAVDYFYGKDASHAWILADPSEEGKPLSWQIVGADPATFALVSDTFLSSPGLSALEGFSKKYTKDKTHVYIYGQLVRSADPATFIAVDPPTNLLCKPTNLPCQIDAHDQFNVYHEGKILGVTSPAANSQQ